jgi:hypothetical protein
MKRLNITTNHQLQDYCDKLGIKLVGIFYKNELPSRYRLGFHIINIDDSNNEGGTHWTALYTTKNYAYYFDSYGMPCPEEILVYTSNTKHLYYNNKILQHLNSNACGYYVIMWMYFLNNMKNKKQAMQYFNDFYEDHAHPNNERIIEKKVKIKKLHQR